MHPLISVITPTTHVRSEFNKIIAGIFTSQDYPNKEHLFDYGEGNVGEKRNRLCARAQGTIIVHMDSDDWYAPDWVSKSVEALLSSRADIVGLSQGNFHKPHTGETWQYTYPKSENLFGATHCYFKSFWEQNPFKPLQVGEDNSFVYAAKKIHSHGYVSGFLATIHGGNTSPKNCSGERWVKL